MEDVNSDPPELSGSERRRREAVRRALSDEPAAAIAEAMGTSEEWVRVAVSRFTQQGVDGLADLPVGRPRGNERPRTPPDGG